MILVDGLARVGSLLARILASRVTLGVAALLIAGSAVWNSYQDAVVNQEVKCRSELGGQLDDVMAASFQRIESGLVAVARGDQTGLSDIADEAELASDAFERARTRRVDAVQICAVDPVEEISTFVRENRIAIGLTIFGVVALVMIRIGARTNRDIARVQQTADEIHHEVQTANDLTLGKASDAEESRRVNALPEGDRTPAEQHHLDDLPPKETP